MLSDKTMADKDEDYPNRLWCVCRRPAGEDKFMICCDCCHEWYHGECVDVSQSQEHTDSDYVSPLCVPSSNSQYIQWPLPAPTPASFQWGNLSGQEFCDAISLAYDEIVHWKRNLFQVPSERLLFWRFLGLCGLL